MNKPIDRNGKEIYVGDNLLSKATGRNFTVENINYLELEVITEKLPLGEIMRLSFDYLKRNMIITNRNLEDSEIEALQE